ncbi:MAG: SMC-Scp complex subunit ScpB [Gammaproteobacteria bacterium]|nr:SMC-Scp complex subunit ScpB [Gammaproteobacteria bacterium]
MLRQLHRRILVELSVDQIKRIIEASLLMNREPQPAKKIAELFTPEENVNERAIIDTLTILADDYRGRGIELVEVATGYRFQVCADLAPWIQRTMAEKPQRYSRALLETLALIAYRQPITRAEIEEVRGVVVSTQIMRTLEEREWVRVIGHRDVPGRPALYATTKQFLNDLNLKSLGELPTLAELQDLDKIDGEIQQLNLDIANPQESTAELTELTNDLAHETQASEDAQPESILAVENDAEINNDAEEDELNEHSLTEDNFEENSAQLDSEMAEDEIEVEVEETMNELDEEEEEILASDDLQEDDETEMSDEEQDSIERNSDFNGSTEFDDNELVDEDEKMEGELELTESES